LHGQLGRFFAAGGVGEGGALFPGADGFTGFGDVIDAVDQFSLSFSIELWQSFSIYDVV